MTRDRETGALAPTIKRRLFLTTTIVALGRVLLPTSDATAEPQNAPALDEIVVTAQRIAEPLSKTPVTVSAFGGAELATRNYTSVEDFKGAVPGLQVNDYVGQARANIRGIGQNTLSQGMDSQIAFNQNGVFLGQSFTAAQAFLDVERVEVLRGPQGTLYGRNATGGAINIISARPTEDFQGHARLSFGNHETVRTELVASGALAGDRLLGRLAFSTDNQAGYSLNLHDGKHYDDTATQSVRGTLVFNINPDWALTVIGDYFHRNDGSRATHLLGTSPGFPTITGVVLGGSTIPLDDNGQAIDPRLLNINTLPHSIQNSGGVLGELAGALSDDIEFKSLTAWRQADVRYTLDFDSTEIAFPGLDPGKDMSVRQNSKQFSQEFQLIGETGAFQWVTGLYYLHQKIEPVYYTLGINVSTPLTPFVVPLKLGGSSTTNAYAGFGQLTWRATQSLSLTGGLRYSYEDRSGLVRVQLPAFAIDDVSSGEKSFEDLSPKFTLSYQANPAILLYATVSKGFQSGGFDVGAQPPPGGSIVPFKPETVWNYEGGIKFRKGWVSADLAAFHSRYSDLQVSQIVDGLPQTTNAASSRIHGVELSTTLRPIANLTLSGSFAYVQAEFRNFVQNDPLSGLVRDLDGNQLPGAPRYSSNLFASYTVPVGNNSIDLVGEWNWHDRIYFSEFNSRQVSQPAVSTFNASIRFNDGDGRWYMEAFGKNLTNELIATQKWITGAGFGSMVLGNLASPRLYGVSLHYNF